jgi:hypothetical protein
LHGSEVILFSDALDRAASAPRPGEVDLIVVVQVSLLRATADELPAARLEAAGRPLKVVGVVRLAEACHSVPVPLHRALDVLADPLRRILAAHERLRVQGCAKRLVVVVFEQAAGVAELVLLEPQVLQPLLLAAVPELVLLLGHEAVVFVQLEVPVSQERLQNAIHIGADVAPDEPPLILHHALGLKQASGLRSHLRVEQKCVADLPLQRAAGVRF